MVSAGTITIELEKSLGMGNGEPGLTERVGDRESAYGKLYRPSAGRSPPEAFDHTRIIIEYVWCGLTLLFDLSQSLSVVRLGRDLVVGAGTLNWPIARIG